MRGLVQRPFACAIVGLVAVLSDPALVQSAAAPGGAAEEPEEVTIRGRKTLTQCRLEMERAREEIVETFNEANSDEDNDVVCRNERPTGSRMPQRVYRSAAENKAQAIAARSFLDSLFASAGGFITNTRGVPPPAVGPQVNAEIGTGEAQQDGVARGVAARAKLQAEIERLMGENRQVYRAVVKYVELEDEYNKAREAIKQ